MKIGYARISTDDQSHALQLEALKKSGCERIYEDVASGGTRNRPQLQKMLESLQSGDIVCVWKLDRLSRSLKDLLLILEQLGLKGAGFNSLTESIDTTTAAGRMMMQIVGSFAEFERSMIIERVNAGLKAARAEGRIGGRRRVLSLAQRNDIIENVLSGRKTAAQCARLYKVSPATVCRLLASHSKSMTLTTS